MSDTYEVHVPCGKNVLIVCKEKGEDVEVKKNGETVYGENKSNLPRLIETKKNESNLPRLIEDKSDLPRVFNTPEPAGATLPEPAPATRPDAENNSVEKVENDMAGGKKSRRNNARKQNATRRKGQAGGKRGPNGYMKFANKIRPQILKEHPELKSDVVGVARKIGEKWRSLSDAEKKKY